MTATLATAHLCRYCYAEISFDAGDDVHAAGWLDRDGSPFGEHPLYRGGGEFADYDEEPELVGHVHTPESGSRDYPDVLDGTAPICLRIGVCDQRRGYVARFATEAQALTFVEARWTTHAVDELEAMDAGRFPTLFDLLYPTCEHGLSASLCDGPGHYPADM